VVIEITDEELEAEALAADPDEPIDDGAEPFTMRSETGLLPEWYMPAAGPIRRTRPRMIAVVGIIASLLVVNGAGLCVTYGLPEIAW
jgi:hypothetical protein